MATPGDLTLPAASYEEPADGETEDSLLEEIQLQEILDASLDGTLEDTPARRSEIKTEMLSLKAKLKKLGPDRRKSGSAHASSSRMNGTNGHPAYSGGSPPFYMAAPVNDFWSARAADQSRKRTYSNHLGIGEPSLPEPKSRKTTPNPQDYNLDSPFDDGDDSETSSVIDLTGVNDDDMASWRERQKEHEGRFRLKKEQEEEDARFARQLQNADSDLDTPGTSTSRAPSPSGPIAFDRIFDRSSHVSQQSQSPSQPRAGGSSRVKTEPMHSNQPTAHSLTHVSGIPTHLKLDPSTSTERFGQTSPTGGLGPSVLRSRGSRMPGTYESDSDDDIFMQYGHASGGTSYQPLSNSSPGFSSASSLYGNTPSGGPLAPGDLARQVAFLRQQQMLGAQSNAGFNSYANGTNLSSFNQPQLYGSNGPNGPGFPSVTYSPVGPRPGSLLNGSANPLQNGSMAGSSVYPQGASTSGSSLRNVIDLTSGYDYQNGTDSFGNPLPQQIRNFVEDYMDSGKTDEQIRELLANISPDMEVPPDGQEGTPDGLKCFLYRHQKIALKWMEGMELDNKKKGGILADDMGLGKTISTIALMLSRRRKWNTFSNTRPIKTNVIVGPVALIRQWEREMKRKINGREEFSIHNYHSKKVDYTTMKNYDVVLTTYGTLAAELKKFDTYVKDCAKANREVNNDDLQRICPFLSPASQFHRVILDEAQCIKNRVTKAASAARTIRADYRWCLTGTPMMNSISELASLVEFLQIKPYNEHKTFTRTFGCLSATRAGGHNRPEAMRKLQVLLKAVMLRRSKSSQIDGKPIVELPPKIEAIDHVVFDPDEGQYYHDLEKESRVQISKYLKSGTIGKHYSIALVLLLRLRQACCHPYLHLTDLEYGNNEVPEDAMIGLAKTLMPAVIDRIKEAKGAFECPICYDSVPNPSIMLPCGHDTCAECFVRLTGNAQQRNLQNGNEGGNATCPECRGPVDTQKVINYEIFKQVHMPEPKAAEERNVSGLQDDETTSEDDDEIDPDSDATVYEEDADDVYDRRNLKDFVVHDDQDIDTDDDELDNLSMVQPKAAKARSQKPKKRKKSLKARGKEKERDPLPGELKSLRKDAGKNQHSHEKYMQYLKKIWLPSAKVTKCTELIGNIQKTGEKTIVFSQWTLLLDLLEIPIKHELKIDYRRYDGSMSAPNRDNAVNDFIEKSSCKVILVSLKAGNAGLNLTAASQVIIMDPFWNPYIEMQAVDRAHRIGQKRPVQVHRVLVKETVEDRIVALQEKKRQLVDAALDEGAAKSIGRLGADDLAYLFGIGRR